MKALFEPKSVAVIGATPKEGKAGNTILKNLVAKFRGRVYPINPNYDEILGLKAYASVLDVPDSIDLGIVVVNASYANKVIEESVKKGIKYLIVITAGYREIGGEGGRREQELKKIIKGSKTRVVGPNCLGVLDNNSGLDVLFLPHDKIMKPLKGNISLVFQSGALGGAIIDAFAYEDVGVSRFVSYGNAVDLNELDFIEFLGKDEKTKVIGVYVEGLRDGRAFYDVLEKTTHRKPVVVIKGGRSDKGSKAALSHTGSLAGNYDIFKGAIKQANATLAESFDEFKDYLKAFSYLSSTKNNKVFVLTNGGGYGVLAADAVASSNLELYDLRDKDERYFNKVLPSYALPHNPLDLIGDADAERYDKALEYVVGLKDVGFVVVIGLVQTFSLDERFVDVLAKHSKKKNIVAVVDGSGYAKAIARALELKRVPVYDSPERAINALDKFYLYNRNK